MPFDIHTNPLLNFDGLPRFDQIKPEHVAPAIDTLLDECRAVLKRALQTSEAPSWETLAEPLDTVTERLGRAWGAVSHLNAVADTAELRAQYNAALPKLTAFWTELSQNEQLFARYKQLAARSDFANWPDARRKVIDNELRDFRLGGAELPADKKERYKQIRERQAQISTRFSENVLDATNSFALYIDDAAELTGIPEDTLQMYREAAQEDEDEKKRNSHKITLHFPSYFPVMQYADNRKLREQIYQASATRASEFGKPEWDNNALMIELLRLRREQAALLGFANFAELSLEPKMADRPAEVLDFLRDLNRRAKPYAERDMAELRQFAKTELSIDDLQAWDVTYASEKLRQQRYAYSEQDLKQYFPEPRVLAGLFKLIETLFGVAIRPDSAPVWHPDVKFFRIESLQGEHSGELVGQFYLDLYAREHKQGGAWQDDARGRRRWSQGQQTPVSFLVCNFTKPVGGKPALLTHDEVLTLFHEFGHGLHHMLTRVDELSVAGIRGVEWDAVELPSQFMENFAWEWEVLQLLTEHVDTKQPLPRTLFDKMIAAKNFQSGMQMARQLEFALLDMRLHTDFNADAADAKALLQLVDEVRREVAVVFPPSFHRGTNTFTHVFSGGYAAGYYSYKWAEVLSADCYAAFEEKQAESGTVLNTATGQRFRDEILAVGGSRPAMQSFVAFRGRKPAIDALLRHSGLSEPAAPALAH